MPERKCQTCKHYEPSPIRRMGWCRNPLLYTPQQSHLVDQNDLDCGRGVGNYWEPILPAARSEPLGPQGEAGDQEKSRTRPLKLFARQPQLAPAAAAAGGGVMASSTSGGSGGGSGGGYRPPSSSGSGSGQPPRGGSSGGAQPPSSGPPRPGRPGGVPPGQERVVSYQREDERYWTDYLRVALTIVGLLLLVGLLWFWLASIIGDDNNDEPTATPDVAVLVTAPAPTATATLVIGITTTQGPAATITPGGDAQPTNTPEPGEEPTEEGGDEQPRFAVDDVVVTNDPDVNVRSGPTTQEENVLETIAEQGTELTITGESVEGDDRVWWPVLNVETGVEGYVADELIDPADE
jgi:hypothetical protein